ncbi:MAG TPA: universal stress protein [Bdellovibrio sp.]|nr:universal stress protein [Bdellovibrio sp.]
MSSRSILLVDDLKDNTVAGWERSHALRKTATFLGTKLNLGIEMLYVDDLSKESHDLTEIDLKKIQQWKKRVHDSFQKAKSHLPEDASFLLKTGSPSSQIPEVINSERPEFAILGTRGLRGFKKLFLGSVVEDVIRESQRPVLVMGPQALNFKFQPNRKIKILVLTDLQSTSRQAESFAQSLAKKLKAQLTLAHSVGDEIQKKATEELKKKKQTLSEQGIKADVRLLLAEGRLSDSIIKEIQKGPDILIMGTRSRGKTLSAILGSSTRTAILNAKMPVIVVKSS